MLADVVGCLACPVCAEAVVLEGGALRCANGHSFDVARQGYVNLLPGRAKPGTADTAEMVAAREVFLAAGHFAPIAEAVALACADALAAPGTEGCIVESGAGTGYYLASVLDRLPGRAGIALDISRDAARRAARAHPRIGAAVCDAWARMPVGTGAAALVLDIFAPRNPAEFARVLAPGGALVVAWPGGDHLREIVSPLGLLSVDEDKEARLAQALDPLFERVERIAVHATMGLSNVDVRALVAMGPSSRHVEAARLEAAVDALPEPVAVTLSVTVSTYRPRGGGQRS